MAPKGAQGPQRFNHSQRGEELSLSPSLRPSSGLSPLHADPGGVEDAHQAEHALQDVSDDLGRHAQRADLRQGLGLDVSHRALCFVHQRLRGSDKRREGCRRGEEGDKQ